MQTPDEYGQWYYLMYLLPGGIALLLLLLSSLGGGGRHHRGVAGHGGSRHMVHSPGSHRGGAHSGPKHHSARATAGKGSSTPSAMQQMLAFFGVGRLPLPFIWGSVLLGWGLFGFWGTRLWEAALHHPPLFILPSLVTAIVGALATARVTSALGARLLPQEASSALSTVDLCGRTGAVTYPVDEVRGRVHVYDDYGTLHDVQACVAPGQPPVGRGRQVLVTDYDAAQDRVIVEEM